MQLQRNSEFAPSIQIVLGYFYPFASVIEYFYGGAIYYPQHITKTVNPL